MKVRFYIAILCLLHIILFAGAFLALGQIDKNEAFIEAVDDDDLTEVKALLKAGANVNAQAKVFGQRALFFAVRNGNKEMVQLLLDYGAKVNATNSTGETALMYTYTEATAEIVRMLVARGANVNAKDKEGNTALISMAVFDNLEVLQAFIEAGANVNTANKDGVTALMRAAKDRELRNVQALLIAGADINAKDKDGWTALTYAQKNKDSKVIQALEVFRQVKEGKTSKDEGIVQLNEIKRCDANPDPLYDRRKVLEQLADVLNNSIGKNGSYEKRGYYINGDDRPRHFFIQDLTDTTNQGSSLQCINLINKHVYHFAPHLIPFSFSHILILDDKNLKIFKSINCKSSKDKIEDVVLYLNQMLKTETNKDEIINRVQNYRKYGMFVPVHDFDVGCN